MSTTWMLETQSQIFKFLFADALFTRYVALAKNLIPFLLRFGIEINVELFSFSLFFFFSLFLRLVVIYSRSDQPQSRSQKSVLSTCMIAEKKISEFHGYCCVFAGRWHSIVNKVYAISLIIAIVTIFHYTGNMNLIFIRLEL